MKMKAMSQWILACLSLSIFLFLFSFSIHFVQDQGAYGQNNTTTTNDTDDDVPSITTEERIAERKAQSRLNDPLFAARQDQILKDIEQRLDDELWKDCAADKTPEEELKECHEKQGLWPSPQAADEDIVEEGEKLTPVPSMPGYLVEEEEEEGEP
jgi:hypothetical protein